MKHLLSKSTFIAGKQCEKRLWFRKHRRDLIPPVPASQQFIFDQGTDVGVFAQQRYPGGEDVTPESFFDFGPSIERTRELIASGAPAIYEAAFLFDGVLVAVDILVRGPSGWQAVEVKSSTRVSEVHLDDAALQHYVITNCGIDLEDIRVMHINRDYVRRGDIDVEQLFVEVSVLEEVLQRQEDLTEEIDNLKTVVQSSKEPNRHIGPHCSSPYGCEFMHHCWAHIPDYSVFNVSRLSADKKWELYHLGITEVADIPDDFPLSANQRFEVTSARQGAPVENRIEVNRFLGALSYPLYFFDVETFAPATPVFEGTSPYRQQVFQYSIHRVDHPGAEPVQIAFLADPQAGDFRRALTEQMIADLGTTGSIVVYNISFERSRLTELAEVFPDLKTSLFALTGRMADLMEPFQKKWFYLPEMRGSYSIKRVLPSMVPGFSYDALAIGDGGTASATFAAMVTGTFRGDTASTRRDLLSYCELDTLAMVEIWKRLEKW